MQECELCGRKTEPAYLVSIDGVELGVCARCAKGRHVISEITDKKNIPTKQNIAYKPSAEEAPIIEDYGTVIRKARERMKLPLKVLAEMLNEKETLLLRIEEQKTLPPNALAKKLERALSIKLQEAPDAEPKYQVGKKGDDATLGEFVA